MVHQECSAARGGEEENCGSGTHAEFSLVDAVTEHGHLHCGEENECRREKGTKGPPFVVEGMGASGVVCDVVDWQ